MRVVIIEDEPLIARKLASLLTECDASIGVEASLESIEASVKWLEDHPLPDLLFVDIQLSDGLCFEIFKRVDVRCPVIFTTAYDEYMLQAFKVNSIDYLLKPVSKEDLSQSLRKYRQLKESYAEGAARKELGALLETLTQTAPRYKSRFVVKAGQGWITIFEKDIAYFMSDRKLTFLVTREGKRHVMDESLDDLESQLHPHEFFRVNRQCIANAGSIAAVHAFFNGKLKLLLKPQTEEEVLVSRKRAPAFKKWLDQ
ncbi:MAG: response regulator transcription factor [Bacteroidetes bacterium]|nr:response regulator transcription factor [Bacteroidota bacterium]